ncbi:MAG: glycosyltransferase family 2 protein [Paludibacteraceae bacterium]|nr:glycosyltransferase family 2 protein [Paludibacteraceae bacterium]OPZ02501.1 MAG: Glycosyl transferase family 2 [Bacteroidetes bacterium ADurb.BinA395]HPD25112.1 glycosyltransferase family 2 protein [Bacteroidales bacterium]HRT81483.1 glycosyltransferase family 2 protein [Bacteroidales bacterium]
MKLNVCLINYNNYEDTIACLNSLLNQSIDNFNVVLVDNCSTNQSVFCITDYLLKTNIPFANYYYKEDSFSLLQSNDKTLGKKIYIIQNDKNAGFAGGNNVGVKFSRSFLSCDLFLFLNNDTVVPENFIEVMVNEHSQFSTKHQSYIALSAIEFNYYTKKKSHNGFHYLNLFSGFCLSRPIVPYFKYICGACLMVDEPIPFMDEGYFLYFEDTDYSKQLIGRGFQLCKTDKTRYFHKIGHSMQDNLVKSTYHFTSLWKFMNKYYPRYTKFVLLLRYMQYICLGKKDTCKLLVQTYKTANSYE